MSGTVARQTLVSQGVVRPLVRLMLEGRSASAGAENTLAADTAAWALSHVLTDGLEVSLTCPFKPTDPACKLNSLEPLVGIAAA